MQFIAQANFLSVVIFYWLTWVNLISQKLYQLKQLQLIPPFIFSPKMLFVFCQNQAKIMPSKKGYAKYKSIKGSVHGLKMLSFWYSASSHGKIAPNILLASIEAIKITNPAKSPETITFLTSI